MKKVYLFKRRKYGNVYSEDYFCGLENGKPTVSCHKENAKSFITKRSAYFYGAEHGLDWWIGAWR